MAPVRCRSRFFIPLAWGLVMLTVLNLLVAKSTGANVATEVFNHLAVVIAALVL